MRHVPAILAAAVLGAAVLPFPACMQDDSQPSRPRTQNPFVSPDAVNRAEQRALENPGRSVPTGGSGDAPRQLNKAPAPADPQVATLFSGAKNGQACPVGNTILPTDTYDIDIYNNGPIPHIPAQGTTVPMTGSAPVPDSPWTAEFSMGQGLALTEAPHRAWPEITATYYAADVKHNPVYYSTISSHIGYPVGSSYAADMGSLFIEAPWFYLNTAALPVLMILEPPLAQRTTSRVPADPNFHGHLPAGGPIIPSPTPGQFHWDYPFLNPDGSIKARSSTTIPATPPTRIIEP